MGDCRPLQGEGERRTECPFYDDCLDLAVQEGWKNWNCSSCSVATPDKETPAPKAPEKRLCEDCGKKPTLSPTTPYCASCMAIRGNKKRQKGSSKKNSGNGKEKVLKAQAEKPSTRPVAERSDSSKDELLIRFGPYIDLLRDIEQLSKEEIRPVDLQVIFLLREALRERKGV